jgi:4'-phosphopantetheinyl transferase
VVWLSKSAGDAGAEAARLCTAAAADLLGVPAGHLRLTRVPSGRPVLASVPDAVQAGAAQEVSVSISHTRGLAAAAVSTCGPVGVDIEPVRPLPAQRLAIRWFSSEEAAWLAGLPTKQAEESFLALWTQKEAVAKALGTGLRGGALLHDPVARPGQLDGEPGVLRLTALPGRPAISTAVTATRIAEPAADTAARARRDQDDSRWVLAVACTGPAAAGAPVVVKV